MADLVWTGLHPWRYRFGYAVVCVTTSAADGRPRIVDARHAWTRGGADGMAHRLNREEREALVVWLAEHRADLEMARGEVANSGVAGGAVASSPLASVTYAWSVRRMCEHPGR
jgi:hypothetical protein